MLSKIKLFFDDLINKIKRKWELRKILNALIANPETIHTMPVEHLFELIRYEGFPDTFKTFLLESKHETARKFRFYYILETIKKYKKEAND